MAFFSEEKGFQRAIHSLEDSYFRNKFEEDYKTFAGRSGIGVISDTEAQPIVVTSHLGRFAIVTVSKIVNINELEKRYMEQHRTFSETSQGDVNPTELVAMLIAECKDFVSGIENVYWESEFELTLREVLSDAKSVFLNQNEYVKTKMDCNLVALRVHLVYRFGKTSKRQD